jgi:TonB family protein
MDRSDAVPTTTAEPPHGASCSLALSRLDDFAKRAHWGANRRDGGPDGVTNTGAMPRGPREPWSQIDVDRWQMVYTNYQQLVTADRRRPLGDSATAFAGYLNAMHARIHAIFVDGFLASLDSLPPDDPLSNPELHSRLEMVLDATGTLVSIGVVKSSGLPTFDVSALTAVERAQPFATPPVAILSADGRVYVHWIFFRDERCGCATFNVRPQLLF